MLAASLIEESDERPIQPWMTAAPILSHDKTVNAPLALSATLTIAVAAARARRLVVVEQPAGRRKA